MQYVRPLIRLISSAWNKLHLTLLPQKERKMEFGRCAKILAQIAFLVMMLQPLEALYPFHIHRNVGDEQGY
jgi:hypothetical protein